MVVLGPDGLEHFPTNQGDPARPLRSLSPRFAFALGRSPADIEGAPLLEMVA